MRSSGVCSHGNRWLVVCGIAVANVSADGAAVAHLRIPDLACSLRQQRTSLCEQLRGDELLLGGHGPDHYGAVVLTNAAKFFDVVEVYQVRGRGES